MFEYNDYLEIYSFISLLYIMNINISLNKHCNFFFFKWENLASLPLSWKWKNIACFISKVGILQFVPKTIPIFKLFQTWDFNRI